MANDRLLGQASKLAELQKEHKKQSVSDATCMNRR